MSLIKEQVPYKVLLPARIWEEAQDKEEFKKLLAEYMSRYPNYIVKGIKDGFAWCERRD
jgi:hypothetical protein